MKSKAIALTFAAMAAALAPAGTALAQRTSAPVESASELQGNNGILLAGVAAVAIIAGIIIIADDDNEPVSA